MSNRMLSLSSVRFLACLLSVASAVALAGCGAADPAPPPSLIGDENTDDFVEEEDLGEDAPYYVDEETDEVVELTVG